MYAGRAFLVPGACQVGGGVHLGPHRVGVQERGPVDLGGRMQLRDLVVLGGDGDRAGPLEVAVDAEPAERGLDRGQVLRAEPLQRAELGREPLPPVGRAVGQAGLAEAAVASAGRPADAVALDEHHRPAGIGLLGQQGGPQPAEAAPDHRQIAGQVAAQRLAGRRRVRPVQPERRRLRGHDQPGQLLAPRASQFRRGHPLVRPRRRRPRGWTAPRRAGPRRSPAAAGSGSRCRTSRRSA